jgi:hypothetical protein
VKGVIVFGAYGVFGRHVASELAKRGVPLTVAGRDLAKAEAFARELNQRAAVADVTNIDSCRAVLDGHAVAVNCAGPFNALGTSLLDACLDAGCHYCDIADDRGYAAAVRGYDQRFRDQSRAAVYGCSSLPGISGSLALRAMHGATPVERVRVTLFIGNKNPKGRAAVGSLVAQLGRPIVAPQGELRGFREREVVDLPPPFGRRAVFNFQSPEYDLFPLLLGAKSVSVKVGFESRFGTYACAALAKLGLAYGRRTAALFDFPGRLMGWYGHSGGFVMTELFLADDSVRRAAIGGPSDGQRMAALPCALVAQKLASIEGLHIGASTAYEFLGADGLLDALAAAGFSSSS